MAVLYICICYGTKYDLMTVTRYGANKVNTT